MIRYAIRDINTNGSYYTGTYWGAKLTTNFAKAKSWSRRSAALKNAKDMTFTHPWLTLHESMIKTANPNYRGSGEASERLIKAGPTLTPLFELVEYDTSTNQVVSFTIVQASIKINTANCGSMSFEIMEIV